MLEIRQLGPGDEASSTPDLGRILVDCVEGGASVSFMSPFSQQDGEDFFRRVFLGLHAKELLLFAAYLDGKMVGTLQLITAMPPNQPHRAELAKLLVERSARRRGIAAALVAYAEKVAANLGKTLLMLDTVTGADAERLYERLGWVKAAVIPNFALFPDGRFCDTTIFWKAVRQPSSDRTTAL